MPGRTLTSTAPRQTRSRPVLLFLLGALALVALGVAIGSRIAARAAPAAPITPAQVDSQRAHTPSAADRRPRGSATASSPTVSGETRAGAAAAAAEAITAFDGNVLLQPGRLRAVVDGIAAPTARADLTAAFLAASAQTRAKLGVDTIPRPAVILRSVPVGYQLLAFSPASARVAVWYVGIVGSGATVEPQQSWRTQTVTLVWEKDGWKVSSFQSAAGPTPPLANTTDAEAPAELFTAIPRFQEFTHANP